MNNEFDTNKLDTFCDSWLDSWSKNRPDKLIEFYTEDTYYSDPARPQGLHGRKELYDYLKKLLAKNPDWKWMRKNLIPNHEGFCLIWTAEIPSNNKIVLVSGMDRIVLSNFKIKRNEVYFDTQPLSL